LQDEKTLSVLSDIQSLKPDKKIEDITIYMSYFCFGVSFQLSTTSYLTFQSEMYQKMDSKAVLRLFIHELLHGFSNEKLREAYRNVYKNDEFMKKTNCVLFVKKSSPSDEEEFVVALEHFVSYKNGLITKEEANNSIFNYYEHCMPLAVIVFNELVNYGNIPTDVSDWILALFSNGVIEVNEIENKVNEIIPGFSNKFFETWAD